MGQKVNPVGIRLGIVKDWDSKWYASSKHYSEYLLSDISVRDFLFKELTSASVSRISIERLSNTCLLYTSPSPRDKRQSRMPSSA